jgi:acylphosphatase
MALALQRREVLYSGRVQGVGFRATARRIAQGYAVTGFVRNLPDRRVELVVEGDAAELDRFLADIAQTMVDYIRDARMTSAVATGQFSTFEVRH